MVAIRVLRVKGLDPLLGQLQQFGITVQHFLGRVGEVGQQPEVQVCVAIGQKSDFQCLHQAIDVAPAGEHARDYHQGPRLHRYTRGKVHTWQWMG